MMCETCHTVWFHEERNSILKCVRCHNAAEWQQCDDNADCDIAASIGPRRLPTQTALHDDGLTASRASNAGAAPHATGTTNASASSNIKDDANKGTKQEERQTNAVAAFEGARVPDSTGNKDKLKVTTLTAALKSNDVNGTAAPKYGTSPTATIPCKFQRVGRCTRGDSCTFAHPPPAAKPTPKSCLKTCVNRVPTQTLRHMQSATRNWRLQHNVRINQ